MKNYGRASIQEFLGDFVIFRGLTPIDPRLASVAASRELMGSTAETIPRKNSSAYALIVSALLQEARHLEVPAAMLSRLIYIGDTALNDGTAFQNICTAGEWPGFAFICSEDDAQASMRAIPHDVGFLYLSNRWSAIFDMLEICRRHKFPIDEHTAVVIDLDKTAIGARGRNDHVIDRARVEAVRAIVGDLLGGRFDQSAFERAYGCLNKQEFHPFTQDNQDYLAYLCMILASGFVELEWLVDEVRADRLQTIGQFMKDVDSRAKDLPTNLRNIHQDVYALFQQGDPTPFKQFRFQEYQTTVGLMGHMQDTSSAQQLLQEEIVITQEVREFALGLRKRGALLFGLSDKPDEASIPTAELASQGYQSIHRAVTHAVGEAIDGI
jgi:hypothetical protein